jgi:hypothetical protein
VQLIASRMAVMSDSTALQDFPSSDPPNFLG